jgi:hypothetical protein
MKEFKFNCPTCGQHILVNTEWSGRKINCPSCQTSITIPELPKEKKKPTPVLPPSPTTHPNYSSRPVRVELPAQDKDAVKSPIAAASPKPQLTTGGPETKAQPTSPIATEPQPLRIAVLTPAVKLDMVRAVRRRLTGESAWLPGKVGGKSAYAAKVINGEPVLVDVKEPQATRFSLLGAFLLELRKRQVIRTATGRTRLLDQEIPDAVRDVLMEDMTDEARAKTEASPAAEDWKLADHAQCHAALDALEKTYSQLMNQQRAEKSNLSIGTTRLPDLIKKI